MSKKQINLSADYIRTLIKEELDSLGNKRYPDGVFSTDSEEGEKFKELAKTYERPDSDRRLKDGWELKDFGTSGEPWKDNPESIWDTDKKRDMIARDEFGDEEKEGKMYDENPEGEENMYFGDPDLEQSDEDEDIAGISEVRLNEEGLRKFISYSVARILQERMGEENRGIMAHFETGPNHKEPNPYEGMTWDEYCAAKVEERAKDKEREMKDVEVKDEKPNLGITAHFDGKKHERTPEDIERDEHMFDDQYWVDKMNLSKDDLMEIVNKCVSRLTEIMDNAEKPETGNEEEVVDRFPKKASGTFTMNTRSGKTDKYRVFVEKTYDEELLTDIFIYDPMDKEWYPQAEYVVGIEEYKDGSWLPYWESFNGDVSIRALANCFGKVVKLWKKVGYLYDEDDEIPFRYAGDIKGMNGKLY